METPKRVYLDDLRAAPNGWIQTRTADETIAHLETGGVIELSLDYDLGPESGQTGAVVLRWIAKQLGTSPDWTLPEAIYIHSTHRVGRPMMIELLQGICQRLQEAGREPPRAIW